MPATTPLWSPVANPEWDGNPAVSVVIPIFNRERRVAGLVDCLKSQTVEHWEAIFVDDGSDTDVFSTIRPSLKDERIRYIRLERNSGAAAARNRGVREARGRFVAFLDSDDHWLPDKLARQLAVMVDTSDKDTAFCVTLTSVMMPGGWRRIRPNFAPRAGESFAHYLYVRGGFAQISSLLLPRALALAHPLREELRQYEDHLLFVELDASGARYVIIPEVLTIWRNDVRQDRLSRHDDLSRGESFLSAATELLDIRVQCAFRLRVLGGVLLRKKPRETVRLAVFGVRQRILAPRQIALIMARHLVPPRLWQLIVRPAR